MVLVWARKEGTRTGSNVPREVVRSREGPLARATLEKSLRVRIRNGGSQLRLGWCRIRLHWKWDEREWLRRARWRRIWRNAGEWGVLERLCAAWCGARKHWDAPSWPPDAGLSTFRKHLFWTTTQVPVEDGPAQWTPACVLS